MASITQYFAQQFHIKLITVSVTNHKSLLAEHGIKSLSNILMKHLQGKGSNWPSFLGPATLSYNAYATPNLDGYSPFELAFGHKAKILPQIEVSLDLPVTGQFKQYQKLLIQRLAYLREHIQKFRDKRTEMWNKDRKQHYFSIGQLVYVHIQAGAMLQTGSQKITCHFVGPLVIYKAVSPNQFLLMSLDGMVYPHLIEETRLKPGHIRTSAGNVSTLADLKQVLRTGLAITEK